MIGSAAIVLGGGESRRMGTDKATLVVDGVAMLDRVVALVRASGIDEIAIVAPGYLPDPEPPQGHQGPLTGNDRTKANERARLGPLAGLVAGWRHLSGRTNDTESAHELPDPVLVLACDLPSLTVEVVTKLQCEAHNYDHGVLAVDGDQIIQPLIAAYRPLALNEFEVAFVNGRRSLRACFDGWDLGVVRFDTDLLSDADTPTDLAAFDVSWPTTEMP